MSLGCSGTNCASSCRRSCAGAEERSAWSSVGSCRLDCTNAQSSQTGRLLPMIQLRLGRPTDQKEIYGRRSLSKPPKPTILDLSHRPHHKRLPRQRFSAMRSYGTGTLAGALDGMSSLDPCIYPTEKRSDLLESSLPKMLRSGSSRFLIRARAVDDNLHVM